MHIYFLIHDLKKSLVKVTKNGDKLYCRRHEYTKSPCDMCSFGKGLEYCTFFESMIDSINFPCIVGVRKRILSEGSIIYYFDS